ncbi:hypothetical protein IQ07DRAFT_646169 [Pyrenochaeta sp. DS3sAY3a]|nr:hypothetical protein IQ07DRAFT_646169 [Pyrenochaeta sp. DS3sAY3a]
MPQFFELPRELRDMIYMEVITWSRPLPALEDTEKANRWHRPWEPKSGLGDHGCAFSSKRAPSTCANFLACNKQVYSEMQHTLERARRKGLLTARMDCIARDEMHYFTWLSIPIVRTAGGPAHASKPAGMLPTWASKYLSSSASPSTPPFPATTTIDKLQLDIRVFPPSMTSPRAVESPRDRTSWAICAALHHVFEHDASLIPVRSCPNRIAITEVILNVVSPPSVPVAPKLTTHYLVSPHSQAVLEVAKENPAHPEVLARELVDVWNKLWSGDEFKARYYRGLLGGIGRVSVCVEGVVWRVREVGGELERGRAERRRIAARMR